MERYVFPVLDCRGGVCVYYGVRDLGVGAVGVSGGLNRVIDDLEWLGYGGRGVVSDLFVLRYRGWVYVLFYVPRESYGDVVGELRRACLYVRFKWAGAVRWAGGVVWLGVRVYGDVFVDALDFLLGVVSRAWAVRGAGFRVVDGVLKYGLPRLVFLCRGVGVVGDRLLCDVLWLVWSSGVFLGGRVFVPVVRGSRHGLPSLAGFLGLVKRVLRRAYGVGRDVGVWFGVDGLCVGLGGDSECVDHGVLDVFFRDRCSGIRGRCLDVVSPYSGFFDAVRERYGLDAGAPHPVLVFVDRKDIERLAAILYGAVMKLYSRH